MVYGSKQLFIAMKVVFIFNSMLRGLVKTHHRITFTSVNTECVHMT